LLVPKHDTFTVEHSMQTMTNNDAVRDGFSHVGGPQRFSISISDSLLLFPTKNITKQNKKPLSAKWNYVKEKLWQCMLV